MRAVYFTVLALAACGSSNATPDAAVVDATPTDATRTDASPADAKVCEATSDQPLPRGDAAGAVDPTTGALFVFGGDTGATVMCIPHPAHDGETWRFDPACNRWTRLSGDATPSPRARTAYAVDARRRQMLIFGGRFRAAASGAYTLYRDVWALDFATGAWREVETTGDAPTARANAAAVVDAAGAALWIFGGSTSTDGASFSPRNDTWRLDLETRAWSRVTAASAPSARLFHAMTAVGSDLVVVGGGGANAFTGPFNRDAWRLDTAAGAWSRLPLSGDTAALAGRINLALVTRSDGELLVLGGHDDGALGNRNDVIALGVDGALTVRRPGDALGAAASGACMFPADFSVPDMDAPERRSAFVAAPDPARHRVIVYGGKTDCGLAGDVWSFDLEQLQWSPLRGTTDGLSCVRTGRDNCRDLCT